MRNSLLLAGLALWLAEAAAVEPAPGPDPQATFHSASDSLTEAACTLATFQPVLSGLGDHLQTRLVSIASVAADSRLPAHCRITGVIDEHTGLPAGTAYGNRFELRLPRDWNGRFYFMGGGGNNGVVREAIGPLPDGSVALARGFAVVSQDSGHAGPSPTFALDERAYFAFAHASVHDAATVAKALVKAHYGRAAERSYFVGCSNGGREAMVSAQRYDDFDGIVAGAPALNPFDQWMQDVWNLRIVAHLAGARAGQVPTDTSTTFTDAQLARIARHFIDKCDARDGMRDGLISDYLGCRVEASDLAALRCPAGASAGEGSQPVCLSTDQAEALAKLYDGPRNHAGQSLFPGFWPGGVEPQWRAGMLGTAQSRLGSWYGTIIPNMFYFGYGYLGYPGAQRDPRNPASYPAATAYVAEFDFDREPAGLEAGRQLFHADNVDERRAGHPDFTRFLARKGRLLIYSGTADPSVQAPALAAFMERLYARHETSTAAVRAFFVPGMGHCSGGAATDRFDPLAAIVDWVEHDRAPQRMEARAKPGGPLDPDGAGLARPLCAYPSHAQYRGAGDARMAASYACVGGR